MLLVYACLVLIFWVLTGCNTPTGMTTSINPDVTSAPQFYSPDGLSDDDTATLRSLKRVDNYPLYTMTYIGPYHWQDYTAGNTLRHETISLSITGHTSSPPSWGCSLFAAFGDKENKIYGRNFDWDYSPALLLFTHPADGFASVSMVDITYLGFEEKGVDSLVDLPLKERQALLEAPFFPFDGMNEQAVVVGMAAVPSGEIIPDLQKKTVGSLMIIREILDHASNVNEAVAIFNNYNIDMQGGPAIHYLIADASGQSVLIEFYQGKIVVLTNEVPWQLATNFLVASTNGSTEGKCWRYDLINQRLNETEGQLSTQDAMELLAFVSQDNTQWSIIYELMSGDVNIVMGRRYENVHTFHLNH
jgi:hypothetical protein